MTKFNRKAAGLTIYVRRSLADSGMRILMRYWNAPDNRTELQAAKDYSDKEVGRLEKNAQGEPNKYRLGSLLAYYSLSQQVEPLGRSAAAKS